MEYLLGEEWEIVPAGGATGRAFYAQHDDQQLFLKRNSSPFLAVSSAEGIVPKLVWTRRLENGDVITAQQWKTGRELSPAEMAGEQVAKLLKKIHSSEPLLAMLQRLGKKPVLPENMFQKVLNGIDPDIAEISVVKSAILFLEKNIHNLHCDEQVVCHCDVNHNNWLLGEDSQLYLIDWDGAMVGDPAIDLGMLLHCYIPEANWEAWLGRYGLTLTAELKLRMNWYTAVNTILSIQWHKSQGKMEEMERSNTFLEELLKLV